MNHPQRINRLAGICAAILCAGALAVSAKVPPEIVVCRVEIDRGVLPAGESQKAVIKITLDATPLVGQRRRPPVNLAVVIDKSGSMRGDKIEKAKQAAVEAVRRLDPGDVFSLVVYDTNVRTVIPAQGVENAGYIEKQIRAISSGGNTALFGGVSQGAAEIRKNLTDKYVHRIILLSDGLANVGPSSSEDLGRLGSALIKEGISVTTVGVGTDYNEDLMANLSQRSDGNTYFVENSRDLPRIFGSELGDVLNIVAKKVKLTIECPTGVEPVSVIGREGKIRDRTVELYLNQLYGGQEKYALVQVQIPTSSPGESREVAVARVTYEDPITQKKRTSEATATAQFSKDTRTVVASANPAVQKAYELNMNAMAQEEAIRLADKGKAKEAVQQLNVSAKNLRQRGEELKDRDLLEKAEQMEKQAEQIEQEGMSKASRKTLRADSYQMKNQQMAQ